MSPISKAFLFAIGLGMLAVGYATAQPSPNPWFQPTYGVGGGGGGGGGDITAVGDCTSGDCLTSGTTTMAGAAVFQSTVATQGIHSFGSAAQTTISAAGAIATTAPADLRGNISNGGSATCFTAVTGAVCVTDVMALAPAAGDGVIHMKPGTNTSAAGIALWNTAATAVGTLAFFDSGVSDADYADKVVWRGVSKKMAALRTDDAAAGAVVLEVMDNVSATGAQLMFVDGDGNLFLNASATRTKGTITLAAGTGTATVASGSVCTCTDTTAVAAVQCSVTTTTLTANGTGTDVIAYHCL